MVVNSREHAPKHKNYNIVVQRNVFMVEHSSSQLSLFFLLASFRFTQLIILLAYVKENKESVFGDFLAPCNLFQVFAENTHIWHINLLEV